MIGGYNALAEKLFISYLCDILRPHKVSNFSIGLNKHTCNNGKTYYHQRNRYAKINAERFFQEYNSEFKFWCEIMDWDGKKILGIVEYCIKNDMDRLYGKNALKAYFNQPKEG